MKKKRLIGYNSLSQKDGKHSAPMRHCTEKHEHMPDSVIMLLGIMRKKICARRIEHTLKQEEKHRESGETLHHFRNNEEHALTHNEVDSERKTRIFSHGKYLIEDSAYHCCPLKYKDQPS